LVTVRDDQMVRGLHRDRDLHVVAHDTGAAAARRHRGCIGIGQRDLLIGTLEHPDLDIGEAPHSGPVVSGTTPSNPSLPKSIESTKASITRTGLSWSIQSSGHSGNSVS
jgi:hypothetical protein